MEAAADEERRMVLGLLEKAADQKHSGQRQQKRPQSPSKTAKSPARSILSVASSTSPVISRPATRSMLDVELPPPRPTRRSMLDPENPEIEPKSPTSPISPKGHKPPSIVEGHSPSYLPPRISSDSMRPSSVDLGHNWTSIHAQPPVDHTSEYQFGGIYTNNIGTALPKRNTQGGRRSTAALSEIIRASEPSVPILQEQSSRHAPPSVASLRKMSKSPHSRLADRSISPKTKHFSTSAGKASPLTKEILTLDSGRYVATDKAYTILSDANLATAGIMLGAKTQRDAEDGLGPLEKTYMSPDGDVILTDSSDADEEGSSDEYDRGRKKTPRSLESSPPIDRRLPPSPENQRKPQSLLAAAEEERVNLSTYERKVNRRSLLEPSITITSPYGERYPSPRGTRAGSVHPATAYDEGGGSGVATPVDSDTEDIMRAQNLTFSQTGIISQSESHRTIRIIYRGEYARIQQEAKDEGNRLRKYLVASDLSEESTHALEWAVGTVLRDGDTLIAICCIDEESGIVSGDTALVPDEHKAMKEQAAAIREMATSGRIPAGASPAPLYRMSPSPGLRPVDAQQPLTPTSPTRPLSQAGSAAEIERRKAADIITEKITKLLRRTRLQVRVIVEVLHCKSPKHLITEVIDLIEPTLVILGSRGRSALKGVILGSFSNYLVTKSSVPVMVARKKLRKTSKYKKAPVRQVNNLEDPTTRSLSAARID